MTSLTGKGRDVIFEEALGFSGFGHETGQCSFHVSPLGGSFFSHYLVVRHRLSKCLKDVKVQM